MVGWRIKFYCPSKRPGPEGGVSPFLRDPSPYLSEFRRKPRKSPNGLVDKRNKESNAAPLVYQFKEQSISVTSRAGRGFELNNIEV